MLEAERHRVIARIVRERSLIGITQLVEILNVSEATVRRDVNALAASSKIRRVRGGVESLTPRHEARLLGMPTDLSQGIAMAQKRAIARAAAALMKDGDNIIIGGGTTTATLAEFLQDRQLDILTNSIPLAMRLFVNSRNRLTLPGGTIFHEQNIILNPFGVDDPGKFWGQQLFIGCCGIGRAGLMETDPLIVQAQQQLLKRTDEVIVMADSRKLRQRSSMVVAALDQVSTLVTDSAAEDADLEPLRAAGIKVIVVKVAEERAPTPVPIPKQR